MTTDVTVLDPLDLPVGVPVGAGGSGEVEDRSAFFAFPDDPPGHRMLRNVTRPTLTPYLPDPATATGAAVVVCPGGAHHFLSVDKEGSLVARWLAAHGIAAFVLHYRVAPTDVPDDGAAAEMQRIMGDVPLMAERTLRQVPLVVEDGTAAVRAVRSGAAGWGVDPRRVGMMGFSAGGHVAAATVLGAAPPDRPDFLLFVYGALAGEVTVPADAPPLFALWAADDGFGRVITDACRHLVDRWAAAGRSVEQHTFAVGGHGFGMHRQGLPSDGWIDLAHAWMGQQGFLG